MSSGGTKKPARTAVPQVAQRGPCLSGALPKAQQGCTPDQSGQGHLSCKPPQTSAPHLSLPESSNPICLPYFDEELAPGTPLWVIGWGYTQEHGEWDSMGANRGLPPG